MRISLWLVCLCLLFPLDVSASLGRLAGLYKRKKKKKRVRIPRVGMIKMNKLRIKGNIDKKKLTNALTYRIGKVLKCYRTLLHLHAKKKRKGALLQWSGQLVLASKLNGHGRVNGVKWLSGHKAAPQSVRDCFLWNLRGKKLFPPQGQKSCTLHTTFSVQPVYLSTSKKKKRKR